MKHEGYFQATPSPKRKLLLDLGRPYGICKICHEYFYTPSRRSKYIHLPIKDETRRYCLDLLRCLYSTNIELNKHVNRSLVIRYTGFI